MTIYLHEDLTLRGIGADAGSPEHSMHREGEAMRDALGADLTAAGHAVVYSHTKDAAAGIVIAPELDGELDFQLSELGEWCSLPLYNCSRDSAALAAGKLRLSRHWDRHSIPTPHTCTLNVWPHWRLPAVVKRHDGCGSVGVRLLEKTADFQTIEGRDWQFIVQDFVPGRAASVAFLVGPKKTVALLPTFQMLSDDGTFRYQGGQFPIHPDLANRAVTLGRRAIACVPGLAGYVGVDLILGDAPDGSEDYAIEINPRLTTSYVGLRALADFNIAQMMLDVFEGKPVDEPQWKPGRVRFWPDGRVEHDPTPGAVWE